MNYSNKLASICQTHQLLHQNGSMENLQNRDYHIIKDAKVNPILNSSIQNQYLNKLFFLPQLNDHKISWFSVREVCCRS